MNSLSVYEDLTKKILSNVEFENDFSQLISAYRADSPTALVPASIKRLVESAAIFACSENEKHKQMALKIVSTTMSLTRKDEILAAASELVLMRMGNFPTLEMLITGLNTRDYLGVLTPDKTSLSTPSIDREVVDRIQANQILRDGRTLLLTNFQALIYDILRRKKSASISAPTSAGKSFVLERYIVDILRQRQDCVVAYVVPTKALISEIQREFRKILRTEDMTDVPVFTTSWEIVGEGKKPARRSVWVLTQERLQSIESRLTTRMTIDLMVVDEAQRIEEGARGIVLEEAVSRAMKWNPSAQFVFLSPFTENPEKLVQIFPHESCVVKTSFSPVDQNIFLINAEKKKVEISFLSRELRKILKLPELEASSDIPHEVFKKKAWVVKNFIRDGPTMVFCNGPSDCIKTAAALSEVADSKTTPTEVREVIDFLSRNIHKDYYLNDFLAKGIAFHYGRMPSLVKVAVVALFSRKLLNTMCCTTTLLEGINLPARNLVLYKPRVGKHPMDRIDFLNLTGRAGRLMKDFCGDIYCVDVDQWDAKGYKPGTDHVTHTIESSMESVVRDNKQQIMEHLRKYLRSRFVNEDMETVRAAVTRFIISELRKENKDLLARLRLRDARITDADLAEIESFVEDIVRKIELPGKVILKNESIDPRLQDALYRELVGNSHPAVPTHHPLTRGFYDDLVDILTLTNRCFKRGMTEGQVKRLAYLCARWVTETSLGEIIADQIQYERSRSNREGLSKKGINDIIESLIDTLSNEIEFRTYRDISCYMDILAHVLEPKHERVQYLSNLAYYVEMGAHKPTTITLMNQGMPRTIAIMISRRIGQDIQSVEEANHVISQMIDDLRKDIPSVILDDVLR